MEASVEQRTLVVACGVGGAGEREQRVASALAEGVDWASLLALARLHRVEPLLHGALPRHGLGAAGEAARARLEGEAERIARSNVYLAGKLLTVLRTFAESGLDAVPYKGPTLAVAAYGSLAMRRFDDLDLVVRWREFARAKAALAAAGFHPAEDEWAAVRHLSHEQAFDSSDRRVQVDLHGRLFSRELFAADVEELWSRRETVRFAGGEARTFGAEDLAVILCEHAHKHYWVRLAWLADLAHLLRSRAGFDWEAATSFARRVGSRRVFGLGLALAAELLAAPVPLGVLREIGGDPELPLLVELARGRLFGARRAERVAEDFELSSLQWRSRDRWRDRLRYAVTPNESDWVTISLPAGLRFLYYAVRPFRLASKYGIGRLRRLG